MGKFKDIWDRSLDGNRREQRTFARYAIFITALFVLFLFVKKDNVIRWIQAGFTIARQERQIERYRRENVLLERKIGNLSSDRDTLEAFAREEFFFCEPGDDVYIVK